MSKFAAGFVCLILISFLAVPSCGISYTVGDSAGGWALGVDYATWATTKTFNVGDTLVFSYGSGHTVSEVSASDYNTCNAGNAINTDSSGATTIPLTTTGTHYFICGVMGHCDGGMKLAVIVTGGDAEAPSESASAPASSTTVSQSPLPPTITSDPPSITMVSQTPLISPTAMTSKTTASASETVPISSSSGTLSAFGAALITCSIMVFWTLA